MLMFIQTATDSSALGQHAVPAVFVLLLLDKFIALVRYLQHKNGNGKNGNGHSSAQHAVNEALLMREVETLAQGQGDVVKAIRESQEAIVKELRGTRHDLTNEFQKSLAWQADKFEKVTKEIQDMRWDGRTERRTR